jgi:hypothetical protein
MQKKGHEISASQREETVADARLQPTVEPQGRRGLEASRSQCAIRAHHDFGIGPRSQSKAVANVEERGSKVHWTRQVNARSIEGSFKLGGWVRNQRISKDNISADRRKRLDEIGFVWRVK